jgi:hypothetical protein
MFSARELGSPFTAENAALKFPANRRHAHAAQIYSGLNRMFANLADYARNRTRPMTKTLEQQLTEAESLVASVRKQLEASQQKQEPRIGFKFKPTYGGYQLVVHYRNFTLGDSYDNFRDAFSVMLELRAQPGIVNASGNTGPRVVIYYRADGIQVEYFSAPNNLISNAIVGPCYATRRDAHNAIDAVGQDRIEKAFRTLSFAD